MMELLSQYGGSVAIGLLIGLINFFLLNRLVASMVNSMVVEDDAPNARKYSGRRTIAYFILKMGWLMGSIGFLLWKEYVDILPFVLGLGISISIGILWQVRKR